MSGREVDSDAGTEMLLSGALMLKAVAEDSVQGAEAILGVSVRHLPAAAYLQQTLCLYL